MSNLGDSPMYLINGISQSFQNAIGAAKDVQLLFLLGIVVFLALYFKLDRGAITLLGIATVGVALYLGIIAETHFYLILLVVAAVAAYGILQGLRQGAG